jgi:hypothetical protein
MSTDRPKRDSMSLEEATEVAPEKQTRELRTTLLPLELLWAAITQRLV